MVCNGDVKRERKTVHASDACFCCHEFKENGNMIMDEGHKPFMYFKLLSIIWNFKENFIQIYTAPVFGTRKTGA
jgi:hypothetical protein